MSVVLTFFANPRMVVQKGQSVQMIDTLDEKIKGLELLGINHLVIHPFSKEFSRTSATAFARDILAEQLNCKHVIIGYDHRFGQNREASIEDLIGFGELYGFEVTVIPAQDVNSIAVSSTKIRTAIPKGHLPKPPPARQPLEPRDAVAVAQRAVVRQTFASFFAHCLRGYQEALVLRPPSSALGLRRLIDVPSLVAGRSAAEAALLRRLAETQSFTSLIEQRTSLSSRNGELLLFDHLADRCLSAPPSFGGGLRVFFSRFLRLVLFRGFFLRGGWGGGLRYVLYRT